MNTIRWAAAAAALTFVLTGCAGGNDDRSDSGLTTTDVGEPQRAGAPDGAEMAPAEQSGGGVALADGDVASVAEAPARDTTTGPAIISTGMISLEDQDVADVRLEVRKVVDAHQGTVSEQETTTGDGGEVTSARLVIRVPSASFDDVTTELEGLATLTSSTSGGQDVSAEVVDVEARIRAQRQSVNRIEALLARAETIEQIVSIESQLATRQAELDALVSHQTWLADQTSQSTVTVYVEQPDEERDEPEERDGFLGGLAAGWDSFIDGLGAALTVVGFALPWLLLGLVVAWPAWTMVRRRRGGRPSSEATAAAATAGPTGSA